MDIDRMVSVSSQHGGMSFHIPKSLLLQLRDALVDAYGVPPRTEPVE
jgi:hypothetical protein